MPFPNLSPILESERFSGLAFARVTPMRVLLSGYYGFDNAGDEAILMAIVHELKSLGHDVSVLSQKPDETSQIHRVQAFHRMRPMDVLRALTHCDVLFSGGGGLLQDKTSHRNLTYYLGIIRVARFLRKRVVIFNQSLGPLSPKGKTAVAHVLSRTDNWVRDRNSQGFLKELGVSACLGGDPALLLTPSAGLQVHANRVIFAPRSGEPECSMRLVQAARSLADEGKEIVVLGLQPHEDAVECQRIAQACSAQVVLSPNPREVLDLIAGSGFVVGVRLHAVILAAAARIPFVGVAYDPKVEGFCADAKAPSFPLDFDPKDIVSAVLAQDMFDPLAVSEMVGRARASFAQALSVNNKQKRATLEEAT